MQSLFSDREKAQGLVEYALITVLVSIVVIAGVALLGPAVQERFVTISGPDTVINVGGIEVSLATPVDLATLTPTPIDNPTLVPTLTPTIAPTIAPTLTYQEWCESLGSPYKWKKNGTCVNGKTVVTP